MNVLRWLAQNWANFLELNKTGGRNQVLLLYKVYSGSIHADLWSLSLRELDFLIQRTVGLLVLPPQQLRLFHNQTFPSFSDSSADLWEIDKDFSNQYRLIHLTWSQQLTLRQWGIDTALAAHHTHHMNVNLIDKVYSKRIQYH